MTTGHIRFLYRCAWRQHRDLWERRNQTREELLVMENALEVTRSEMERLWNRLPELDQLKLPKP